jgi:outer membrane protein TolC
VGNYSLTGLDNHYDQSLNRLFEGNYNDWTLGFRYRQTLGRRPAASHVRQAQAVVSRRRAELQKGRHDVELELQAAYQELVRAWRGLRLYRNRREAAKVQVESREILYNVGEMSVDLYLRAQATYAESQREEAQGISRYNQAIANWEFAKGNMLGHSRVMLPEQVPPPQGVPKPPKPARDDRAPLRSAMKRLPPVGPSSTR